MSILNKNWEILYKRKVNESLWSALLNARNIQDPSQFFASSSISDLHNPFLFKDMKKAVERLQKAIHARERIVVYGDYDVDGTSGASILIHSLRFLEAEVSFRVPHRIKDGYGLHNKYIDNLAKHDVKVLITVDCGISCPDEVENAQNQGMDIIITDHHTIPEEKPKAFATIHPELAPDYPFKKLSGSGVAFKLASALLIATKNEDLIPKLTDLASLGTVADCVPLVGENRSIVKLGLKQMEKTEWNGLQAILERAGTKPNYTSETISFQIGPRINAAGRIDDAMWSLQTLLSTGHDAYKKSQRLEELNIQRRQMTTDIMQEAEAKVDLTQPILIAEGAWSSGIVGLIAGRLQEKYGKPSFILQDRGDKLVGSARSQKGFHAVDALNQVKDLLTNYGGHEQAAGFSLSKDNYPKLKEKLIAYAQEIFKDKPLKSILKVDFHLNTEDFTLENAEKITSFAPFGMGNAKPIFLLENPTIIDSRRIGKEENHLKFTAKFGDQIITGIGFNFGEYEEELTNATKLLAHLEINEWKDEKKLQLNLKDFKV